MARRDYAKEACEKFGISEQERRRRLDEAVKARKAEKLKCEAGCMVFDGGEKRHAKGCVYYPESLTKHYDDLEADYKAKIAGLEAKIQTHLKGSE